MKCNLNEMVNLMSARGMSQARLARESGVALSTVNAIINGRSNPTLTTVSKFTVVLGCDASDLVEV